MVRHGILHRVVGMPRLRAKCVPSCGLLIGDCLASCNWHYIHGFLGKSHSLVGRWVGCLCCFVPLPTELITRTMLPDAPTTPVGMTLSSVFVLDIVICVAYVCCGTVDEMPYVVDVTLTAGDIR